MQTSWERLGAILGRLGRVSGRLGAVWGHLGVSLKSSWDGFGAVLAAYGRFCEACFGVLGHIDASLGALRHDFRTKLQNFILDILLQLIVIVLSQFICVIRTRGKALWYYKYSK